MCYKISVGPGFWWLNKDSFPCIRRYIYRQWHLKKIRGSTIEPWGMPQKTCCKWLRTKLWQCHIEIERCYMIKSQPSEWTGSPSPQPRLLKPPLQVLDHCKFSTRPVLPQKGPKKCLNSLFNSLKNLTASSIHLRPLQWLNAKHWKCLQGTLKLWKYLFSAVQLILRLHRDLHLSTSIRTSPNTFKPT